MNTLVVSVEKDLGGRAGTLRLRQKLGETASAGLEKISKSAEKTPSSRRMTAVAHERLGELYQLLARNSDARREFELSKQTASELFEDLTAGSLARADYAKACDKLGDLSIFDQDFKRAAKFYRDATKIRELMVRADPQNQVLVRGLSVSYNKIGDLAKSQGFPNLAKTYYERSYKLRVNPPSDAAGIPLWHSDVRFTQSRIADACLALGDWKECRERLIEALDHAERLVALDPENVGYKRELHLTLDRLGNICLRLNATDEALAYFERSIKLRERLVETDPGNKEAERDLAIVRSLLGDAYRGREEFARAEECYAASLSVYKDLLKREPGSAGRRTDVFVGASKLADLCERQGQFAGAAEYVDARRGALSGASGSERSGAANRQ